jgi:glutaconate CoA-transferase, subunit B
MSTSSAALELPVSRGELQVCQFARLIRNSTVGILPGVRSEVPTAAVALAARMHAPSLHIHTIYGELDPLSIQLKPVGGALAPNANRRAHGLDDLFDILHRREVDWAFYGGLQLDGEGNLNLIQVGDPRQGGFRGPGTAGGASQTICKQNLFVWLHEHSERVMVPQVSFVGVPGHRRIVEAGGVPGVPVGPVVTPLGVIAYDVDIAAMRLLSVHPGVTVEQIVEKTGFPLNVDNVSITEGPTEEELHIIRTEVDPGGQLRAL